MPILLPRSALLNSVLLLLALLCGSVSARANPVSTPHVQAQLISEVSAIQPGQPFWVALSLRMRPGWHTYWRNPGDSGLATQLEWTLPPGFQAGEIHWPYPERIPVGPLLNYGYHGEIYLPVPLTPPADLATTGSVTLQVKASWLVCEQDCIPEEATLSLPLAVTPKTPPLDPRWQAGFARTRQAWPQPSPWPTTFTTTPAQVQLHLTAPELAGNGGPLPTVWFLPFEDGLIEYAAAQPLTRTADGLSLNLTRGDRRQTALAALDGILLVQDGLPQGTAPPTVLTRAFTVAATPTVAPPAANGAGVAQALLFALLGGLILNLMPCVLPVLSMKALSLVKQAQLAPAAVRREGLAFTAGVLVSFAVVAGTLLALRAAGTQIGWGFQLQSPWFVALLAYLLFVLALSLSGSLVLGGSWLGIGSRLTSRPGLSGAFASGALATVVATPCTGPFMGAALGFALTQPWPTALAVFQALGLGLALPYLLLSFRPSLLRFLPKPGAWMERLKELLAFPLYATVAWLIWVLSQQTGPDGVSAVLAGLILIAFALWLWRLPAVGRSLWLSRFGAGTALVAALWLTQWPVASSTGPGLATANANATGPRWEAFSPARLAELQAANRPIFLNATAAWCITCLVNERVALSSPQVAAAFAERGITYLKADWTNRDPAVTRLLAEFEHGGVPLYVYYPAGGAAPPRRLPPLLTETLLLETIQPQ